MRRLLSMIEHGHVGVRIEARERDEGVLSYSTERICILVLHIRKLVGRVHLLLMMIVVERKVAVKVVGVVWAVHFEARCSTIALIQVIFLLAASLAHSCIPRRGSRLLYSSYGDMAVTELRSMVRAVPSRQSPGRCDRYYS